MKILGTRWFGGRTTIGVVRVQTDYDGIVYCISAISSPTTEQHDAEYIAEWGSSFPSDAGDSLFGLTRRTVSDTTGEVEVLKQQLVECRSALDRALPGRELLPNVPRRVVDGLPETDEALFLTIAGKWRMVETNHVRRLIDMANLEGDTPYYTHWVPLPLPPAF